MTITMFNYILYYLIVGITNLAIMDYFINKLVELMDDKKPLTNMERVVILILWPIYSTVFWYNFFKTLIKKD
jgi:hypothetical protein